MTQQPTRTHLAESGGPVARLGGPRALPAPPGSDGRFCSTAPTPPRHPRVSPALAVALGCTGLRLCKVGPPGAACVPSN
jgi:hypothetical protein